MKFFEFLKNDAIRPELEATDKETVIRELLDGLIETDNLDAGERDYLFNALLKREELGSTAIGNGVAIPHTKHPKLQRLVCTMGVSREGVEFGSSEGEPSHIFFLLISPTAKTTDHLRALECISRLVSDPGIRDQIQNVTTQSELEQILETADGAISI